MARDFLELQQLLGGLQRIATELEKVGVDADVGSAEQAVPDFRDLTRPIRASVCGGGLAQ